jgi:hypothetical protein
VCCNNRPHVCAVQAHLCSCEPSQSAPSSTVEPETPTAASPALYREVLCVLNEKQIGFPLMILFAPLFS